MAFYRKTGSNYVFTNTVGGSGFPTNSRTSSSSSSSTSTGSGGGTTAESDEIRVLLNSTVVKSISTISENYAAGQFDSIKT